MSARLVTLAVLLAVVLAGDASAQSSPTFGGGRLTTVSAAPRGYVPTLGVSLQPRGSQIAVRFDTSLRCGSDSFDVTGRKVVAFDGTSFSAASASVQNVARGRLVFEWTMRGTISGAAASGTLHITGARRVSGRRRGCTKKPTRGFEARVAGPAAGAAAQPRPNGAYLGTSGYEIVDHLQAPVILRAGKSGRRVAARWSIAAKCRRGARQQFVNLTPLTRVRADGAFGRNERFLVRYQDALIRYRASFDGHFAGEGASGTLRLRARVYDRRGERLRTRCDSGRRRWNATLGGTAAPAPAPAPAPTSPTPTGEPKQPIVGAWSLTMTSDAGDYIGQGQSWSHGPQTDTLRVWGGPSLVRLYLTNAEGWWDGSFAAPPGQQLTAGATYENAHRYPFNDSSPGLDVGGCGRGCNESTSRFTVDQLAFDPDGTLRTFQVTFEQHCENAEPALRGTWTFHAA